LNTVLPARLLMTLITSHHESTHQLPRTPQVHGVPGTTHDVSIILFISVMWALFEAVDDSATKVRRSALVRNYQKTGILRIKKCI